MQRIKPMTDSAFCHFPGVEGKGHDYCQKIDCTCLCHKSKTKKRASKK